MRLAKAMNAEQFAKVLFNLQVDETVEFGLERSYYADENYHIDEEHPLETYDVSDCGHDEAAEMAAWAIEAPIGDNWTNEEIGVDVRIEEE